MNEIDLAHGSGGRLTRELVEKFFVRKFSNKVLRKLEDSAVIKAGENDLAFTTDSYVVDPVFFEGGDIGRISVCGTVNDLAVKGAEPLAVSSAFILEEGLERSVLNRIVTSMKKAAREAGVKIVAGDTKVVEKGKADKIFITTSGVGLVPADLSLGPEKIRPGDSVIVSGSLADHGIAVMNRRNNLGLAGNIKSDGAPLNSMIKSVLQISKGIKCMRDLTRGGLATVLNEIAACCGRSILIEQDLIRVKPPVKGACDLLGLDPLYVANEGKIVIFVSSRDADKVLRRLRKHKYGADATVAGKVLRKRERKVFFKTPLGGTRPLIMLEGEQLPRIC